MCRKGENHLRLCPLVYSPRGDPHLGQKAKSVARCPLVYSHPQLRGKRQFTFATSPRCASARQPRFSVLVTRHNKHGMVSLEDVLLVLASTARCNARDVGVLGRMCHALQAGARREDVWPHG